MQQAQKRSSNRSFQIFSRQASVFPIAALGLPQKPSFELADYRCYRCPSSATSWPNGCFGNAPTSAFVGNVQSLWSGLKPATSLMPSMVNGPMSWVKHEDPREDFGLRSKRLKPFACWFEFISPTVSFAVWEQESVSIETCGANRRTLQDLLQLGDCNYCNMLAWKPLVLSFLQLAWSHWHQLSTNNGDVFIKHNHG